MNTEPQIGQTPAPSTAAPSPALCTRRSFLAFLSLAALTPLAGCAATGGAAGSGSSAAEPTGALAFNNGTWSYDADNDVYWQVGVVYCEKPAATAYESLGIYVPGAYLSGTENADGTYTCTMNETGTVAGLTAATAPFVVPVNTAGYSAQAAPTSYRYESVSEYLEAGFIYLYPGCRGRDNGTNDDGTAFSGGAPWGATDLKAAVRYVRYNAAVLPGNTDAVFTFGHSGGGAQSAVMGASGDSELYEPYLESIGAALNDAAGDPLSDAVSGAMCWCPITCLDEADAAYEWMMGQYADSGTRADGTWTAAFSGDLAEAFASYINGLGLADEAGAALALAESSDGWYTAGSYADYVLAAIEESLNNFLADTEFPYTPSGQTMADGGFGGGMGGATGAESGESGAAGGLPSGELPSGVAATGLGSGEAAVEGGLPSGELPDGAAVGEGAAEGAAGESGLPSGTLPDGEDAAARSGERGAAGALPSTADAGTAEGGSGQTTYETVQDYLASLNSDEEWVVYDEASNTAKVTSIGAFVRCCKSPSKDVGAFDATDRSQAENKVFGTRESNALHFDATMARLLQENADGYAALSGWDAALPGDYASDREQLDELGTSMDTRSLMYNPLAFVSPYYKAEGTSAVAPHWRIRTGIEQGDTSLTVELNLACALAANSQVADVDFATVWGQGHTTAERTGSSTANFIAWVQECL